MFVGDKTAQFAKKNDPQRQFTKKQVDKNNQLQNLKKKYL